MNDWREYFPDIFCINLKKRTDRLERIIPIFEEYGINATIYEATESEKGAAGLVSTMKKLFGECLDKGIERVLVFEDDISMLENVDSFNDTMNKCVEDLQGIYYDVFYLGVQACRSFYRWHTPNLLPVEYGLSTHAVAYNKKAMEFIEVSYIDEPIDNFLAREFQKYNTSFCSYPLLCSQAEMYSDICENYVNWDYYITPKFQEQVRPIINERFKTNTNL